MIVSCIGYGYISNYLIKELASDGVICFGITDNQEHLKKERYENTLILPRKMTADAINKSTHLVITAAPEKNSCPIILKYKKYIENLILDRLFMYLLLVSMEIIMGNGLMKNPLLKEKIILLIKTEFFSENAWMKLCKKKVYH